ncbi:ABC-2 type transporter-domain-containing protein [Aspergillus nidulans var. acristatus]
MTPIKTPIYRDRGRGLGVVFENVSVYGKGAGNRTVLDLPAILEGVLKLPWNLVSSFGSKPAATKKIIQDVSGVVFPGETLLVLGQPGSGCSTTLKVLANERSSYALVEGDVSYASISAPEMAKKYGSEVVYNAEDDVHYPNLKVKHTLDFALRLRKPAKETDQSPSQFSDEMTDRLLGNLGMSHTKDTIVGNSFVRGVSGGERKRVSLAEVMATNPAIACWDNPIRGLDSSSALQFLQLLKAMSRQNGMANIVTIYQASDSMYTECFDRVLVMYSGKMIFSGRSQDAKQHFLDLGFHMWERQTTPDFLTAVTSPSERVIRKGHTGHVPQTPDEFVDAFRQSHYYATLQADIAAYRGTANRDTVGLAEFQDECHRVKSSAVSKQALEPLPIWSQSLVAVRRYYQLLWKNQRDLYIVLFLNAVNAVINGSAYFMAPKTATGSFEKGGAIFFSLIYFFLNALAEVSSTIHARSILVKQHKLGIIHPIAFVIAQTIADIPVAIFQSLVFSCCYYFMLGLHRTASDFWVFELVLFTHYSAVSSLFRMLGAWAPSLNIAFFMAGTAMPICLTYAGYGPPIPTMHRWGSWIRRISPSPWALEALMSNEFSDIDLTCTANQMIPNGPGYNDIRYQGCSIAGSIKGSNTVPGSTYLGIMYNFYRSHLWRNWGIIVVMWFLYVVLTAIGLTFMTGDGGSTGGPIFKRGASPAIPASLTSDKLRNDVEHQAGSSARLEPVSSSSSVTQAENPHLEFTPTKKDQEQLPDEPNNHLIFSFKDVSYFVNVDGSEKQLLDQVSGYVKPGQLTALMGASGAGKTTLLDTISQRKSTGRVEGQMLLGGKPLGDAFSRSCGFCMQQDVHEPMATVRESLEFSAKLRQPQNVPLAEKMAFVDEIISLLELDPIADALVGEPGDGGLNVEERKRVTIGVELAAKPSALLFLDEPTSGLDSQAAFSIVSFLKKIAQQGVPIVCTIHQPSAILFQMFDHVLLLAPGGRTVYFGETGPASRYTIDYFARHGAVMSENENPAEFIISTITSKDESAQDWPQIWKDSDECAQLQRRITELESQSGSIAVEASSSGGDSAAYALPLHAQMVELTKRHWTVVWRTGPYNFSKLFKCIFCELFIAFTYYNAGPDLQGLQNYMLALLIIVWIIPATAADIQNVWFSKWAIFEARERNGIYDYKALLTALTLVEIPWQVVGYTMVYFCIYWTVGYPNVTSIAGYVYFMFLILSLFATSFCHLMAAIFPNPTLAGYANSLFWVALTVFSGTLVPHSAMNTFYKPWIFWVDPLRYFLGGTTANVLHGVKAECKQSDLTIFDPPPNSTCQEYAARFLSQSAGYLSNPDSTGDCGYCKFSYGDDYAATLGYYHGDRWRDWAVLLGWCLANMAGILFFTWLYRIKLRK